MASSNQSKTSAPNSNSPPYDEDKWVMHIQKILDQEESEEETGMSVSIFGVPRTLMVHHPECYIPQRVAIGPYHYTNPELHAMERHKLDAAKIFQKQLRTPLRLRSLAEQMMKLESRIRVSYDNELNVRGETLAWMMAVDASFLVEFLKVYAVLLSRRSHNRLRVAASAIRTFWRLSTVEGICRKQTKI